MHRLSSCARSFRAGHRRDTARIARVLNGGFRRLRSSPIIFWVILPRRGLPQPASAVGPALWGCYLALLTSFRSFDSRTKLSFTPCRLCNSLRACRSSSRSPARLAATTIATSVAAAGSFSWVVMSISRSGFLAGRITPPLPLPWSVGRSRDDPTDTHKKSGYSPKETPLCGCLKFLGRSVLGRLWSVSCRPLDRLGPASISPFLGLRLLP